jgi:hypothetical protein
VFRFAFEFLEEESVDVGDFLLLLEHGVLVIMKESVDVVDAVFNACDSFERFVVD